ncbi:MAG: mechanosensitive ion channel family protein [Steroidobacteraceae bacterium]
MRSEVNSAAVQDGFALARQTADAWVEAFFGRLPALIAAGFTFAVFVLLAFAIRIVFRTYLRRRERADLAVVLSGLGFWVTLVLGLMLALTIVLPTLSMGDLVASLGIGSIAVGFAFKDILQNWLAGLLILLRRPFRHGDQVEIGELRGTVRAIDTRATHLRTFDGTLVLVPNTDVYSNSIRILTAFESRRVQLDLTVGYEYDVNWVTQLVRDAVTTVPGVLAKPEPQVVAWELGATSLAIRIRWWIAPQRSHEFVTRAGIVQAIRNSFAHNDIDPTDPQLIFYRRVHAASPVTPDTVPAAQPPPVSKDDPEAQQATSWDAILSDG